MRNIRASAIRANVIPAGGTVPIDLAPIDGDDVVQWKFNEALGADPIINYGSAGAGANLTVNSGIDLGVLGNPRCTETCAKIVDTTGTQFRRTVNGAAEFNGDFTISAYFLKLMGLAVAIPSIVTKKTASGLAPFYSVLFAATSAVQVDNTLWVGAGAYAQTLTALATIEPLWTSWCHLGVRRSATTGVMDFIVNGVVRSTTVGAVGNMNWADSGPWIVGNNGFATHGAYFSLFQDIRIANAFRSDDWFLGMYDRLIGTP